MEEINNPKESELKPCALCNAGICKKHKIKYEPGQNLSSLSESNINLASE